ncbi:MAG TPA: ABC transporter ATP-binding protein [Thermoanaerobaculia bacterium]|nr:ABC transporter ATP-binding protein [Thermoanaerobaculia bacterium]
MHVLVRQASRHRGLIALTFFLDTVNQLLVLAEPQILRLLVDRYVMRLNELPRDVFFRGVLFLVGASVVVGLIARIARNYQDYFINLVARRIGAQLYATSLAHSILLPFEIYEDRRSGELLNTITRARLDAEQGMAMLVRMYLGVLAVIAITFYAFTVHPVLGIAHVVLVPLLTLLLFWLSGPIYAQQRRIAFETAAQAGANTETMRNVEMVKSFGIEEQEIDRIHRTNDRILELEQEKLRTVRKLEFSQGTLQHVARAAILLVMLWLVVERAITIGEFVTVFLYSTAIFAPLAELGFAVVRYQTARATFGQLDELLRLPKEHKPADAPALGPLREIRFAGTTLEYPNGTSAVRALDLEIRTGDCVAFVGPSGAGKSSIVKLLVGLYAPTAGAVLFNGVDSRAVDRDELRHRIGLVTHDTHLFAGTVRENLLLGRPDASDAECLAAVERAAATPILERGGHGLDTRIGEGGLKLSGGERQRIAIARALLRDPELIIFDEATSNLDSITERAVAKTIADVATRERTRITILVAHRLSTIAEADRIVVLSQGEVVESGTHPELVARGGLYASMWREQNRAAS